MFKLLNKDLLPKHSIGNHLINLLLSKKLQFNFFYNLFEIKLYVLKKYLKWALKQG